MKKIGFVGGISWVSTLDYYKYVNEEVNKRLGGLNYAECIIYSLNFGDVQRVGWVNSFDLLLGACKKLKKSGVEAIVLCANTAHLFAKDLEAQIELPIISIVTETARHIVGKGITTVGLIGTKFTMELTFYREALEQFGLQVLIPESQEVRDYIQQSVKEELGRGVIKPETKARYISIINELNERGAQGIILGCTEIPLLIDEKDFSFLVFDSTKIHCKAIADFIVS